MCEEVVGAPYACKVLDRFLLVEDEEVVPAGGAMMSPLGLVLIISPLGLGLISPLKLAAGTPNFFFFFDPFIAPLAVAVPLAVADVPLAPVPLAV